MTGVTKSNNDLTEVIQSETNIPDEITTPSFYACLIKVTLSETLTSNEIIFLSTGYTC